MEKDPKSKHRIWDKLIMGAVIGGAIGSVLGASIAPKKGAETRKDAKKGFKKLFGGIKSFFTRKKKEDIKKIPNEHTPPINPRLSHHLKDSPKNHGEIPKN